MVHLTEIFARPAVSDCRIFRTFPQFRSAIGFMQSGMQIRRSAEIGKSGFLHTRNSGKTDNAASSQRRIDILSTGII